MKCDIANCPPPPLSGHRTRMFFPCPSVLLFGTPPVDGWVRVVYFLLNKNLFPLCVVFDVKSDGDSVKKIR